MSLLLPPYGKILLAYQQDSIRLDFPLYIFVGKHSKEHAYAHKCAGTLCTYLPYGDVWQRYNWPIEKQKVVVCDTGFSSGIALKKFCHHLLTTHHPRVIFLQSDTHPNECFLPNGATYNG